MHKEDIMLGFIFVFIIGVIGFPLIALLQMTGQKEVTPVDGMPQKLESPQQPNARLINNALSKHEPELFNYCKGFADEVESMPNEMDGRVVKSVIGQTYNVVNDGDVSYIQIECNIKLRSRINAFTFRDYKYSTKTDDYKFKQVHDDYNRLVHLIRLD